MQRLSTLIKLPFLELADWGSTCDMLAREFDKVPIPTHSAYKKYKSYTLYLHNHYDYNILYIPDLRELIRELSWLFIFRRYHGEMA